MKKEISFVLNGSEVSLVVDARQRLVDVLRGPLGLTGTKEGCGEGECGACTVIMDKMAINSCLCPAFEAEGKSITTIEGLQEADNQLSILQRSFVDHGAIQCGFCTPGMILSAKALLDENPNPTPEEIQEALLGNLCRCTGYLQIVEAIQEAAKKLSKA